MHLSRIALLLVAGCGVALQAHAQSYLSPDPPPHAIEDRFRLEIDVLHGSYDTQMRLDKTTTPIGGGPAVVTQGTTLSGENDLGLAKSQTLLQAELTLLPGPHSVVRLDGLSMERDGTSTLTRNVSFGTNNYTEGQSIQSHLNINMVGLTFGYLPWHTDRYELGATLGVQIASIDANAEVLAQGVRADETGVAPVPLIGLEGRFDFTRGWSVDGRYRYLRVNSGGVKGTIADGRIALRWRQNQHLLYGLGYSSFKLSADSENASAPGLVSLTMKGPLLFFQGSL